MVRLGLTRVRWAVVMTAVAGMLGPAALGGHGAAASPTDSGPPATRRVSVSSSGDQVQANSFDSDISARGRYVAFSSDASKLVAGDTNSSRDVFVRDRRTKVTRRVSVATDGAQSHNDSSQPAISADGRYVAFISEAANLVPGDTNATLDVFVRDRVAKVTRRVSLPSGLGDSNGPSYNPVISGDGRYVAFNSDASNLAPEDTNFSLDVFVRDRATQVTRRVSIGPGGAQADGYSVEPAISADGRYVVFQSYASNLVADDTNDTPDVFVRDRVTHETSRVSVGSGGVQGNSASGQADISRNGRYVAFSSSAANLVLSDTNSLQDVFVRDRVHDLTRRVSVAPNGVEADNYSYDAAISASGGYVGFSSRASNLVVGDTNGKPDVFVRNRVANVTQRVSVSLGGASANGASDQPALSADGRYVSFTSAASNLVSDDTNSSRDVFFRDRGAN